MLSRRRALTTTASGFGALGLAALGLGALPGGAAEAARKPLTPAEISQIMAAEIAGRQTAANQYDALGRASQAGRLRREAAALTAIAQPPA